MEVLLLIVYGAIAMLLLVGLVICVKKARKEHWMRLCLFGFLAAVSALGVARYFDNLPVEEGSIFPGLEYFAEVLYSMSAAAIFAIIAAVALLGYLWKAARDTDER